ncbi:MAG: response regulator [Candidatus Omnitrophota bacterium]
MKKILIIDDEPHIIKMVRSRLEANGYAVITALDGKEGLEKVEKENPDLIIVDVLMPKMDGYTFVRNLKKKRADIPIIILTATQGMTDLFEEEGITDQIHKPFETEELLGKIQKYLG